MRTFNLESVNDCQEIYTNNDYVILSGKNPWIFRKDGTFVAKHKTIREAFHMVFLPCNKVLMDGWGDLGYHYISLDDGHIIWSSVQKGRRGVGPHQFAVSPNGKIAYYVYAIKNILHVDHIHLEDGTYTTYTIPLGLRATMYCRCDNQGNLMLLQKYMEKNYAHDGTYTEQHYIGELTWSPDKPNHQWKHICDPKLLGIKALPIMCDDEYVLHHDLTVYSIKTGTIFDLLENSSEVARGLGGIHVYRYDPERKWLTVSFLGCHSTIIIDCKARKIIAHYVPVDRGLSGGCLIDDEFWIGTRKGVIKRPFPHMDEFPRILR